MNKVLKSVKINNLRSISMDEKISFVPLTILVGKNSAGKSTFARFFPLLRQSCEAKKRGPILWFGDRVDFGSFENSVGLPALTQTLNKLNASEPSPSINFTFELEVINPNGIGDVLFELSEPPKQFFDATLSVSMQSFVNVGTVASQIKISAFGYDIAINISQANNIDSIKCNNIEWKPPIDDYCNATYESILPTINYLKEITVDKRKYYKKSFPFLNLLEIEKKNFSIDERELEFVSTIFDRIPLVNKGSLQKHLIAQKKFFNPEFFKHIQRDEFKKFVEKVEPIVFGSKINELLALLDNALKTHFSGVKYIEPLRATAQRYYRKQELALDEIDSKGENLAMYLDNLAPWHLDQFNQWTQEHFNFSAKTLNRGGHVEIVITEGENKRTTNLADIGFGFSQILPVITQMWSSSRESSRSGSTKTNCIVIEQPELHLHPAFQAKLADVFAASVHRNPEAPHLVIETHSNHLINRLGQLISEEKLYHSDVQILIFQKNSSNTKSTIRKSYFDEEGYLQNWPTGFFEPEN